MIYKITNLLNNKIYIGGTVKTNLRERFNEHFAHAKKYNSQTQKMIDMRNIPKENWTIEKIEDCLDSEIKSRETYYIKKYKNEGYELYNEDAISNAKTCFYSCDIETGEIKKYNSMKETGCNFSKISVILNETFENDQIRFSHKGKLWSYENKKENWIKLLTEYIFKKNKKRKVLCVEKGIAYNSIAEANKDFGLTPRHNSIINCLKYNLKNPNKPERMALGYHWKYIDEELPKWAL